MPNSIIFIVCSCSICIFAKELQTSCPNWWKLFTQAFFSQKSKRFNKLWSIFWFSHCVSRWVFFALSAHAIIRSSTISHSDGIIKNFRHSGSLRRSKKTSWLMSCRNKTSSRLYCLNCAYLNWSRKNVVIHSRTILITIDCFTSLFNVLFSSSWRIFFWASSISQSSCSSAYTARFTISIQWVDIVVRKKTLWNISGLSQVIWGKKTLGFITCISFKKLKNRLL